MPSPNQSTQMKPKFRIREHHYGSESIPYRTTFFYCEKKFLWFWIPVFKIDVGKGRDIIRGFGSLEKSQKAISDYCEYTKFHYPC